MGATAPDERTAESASLARGGPTETAQPPPRASDPEPEGRRTGDPRQGPDPDETDATASRGREGMALLGRIPCALARG